MPKCKFLQIAAKNILVELHFPVASYPVPIHNLKGLVTRLHSPGEPQWIVFTYYFTEMVNTKAIFSNSTQ